MSRHDESVVDTRAGVIGEVVGSLVALAGAWVLLINMLNAYGFLVSATPEPQHMITYAVVALLMLGAVAWTFVSARRRRAHVIAYIWHALVGIVAAAAAVLFMVPQVDWRSLNDPPPVERNINYEPCYSGGDPCG